MHLELFIQEEEKKKKMHREHLMTSGNAHSSRQSLIKPLCAKGMKKTFFGYMTAETN